MTALKEIRRYAAIEELDESVLNRLISKILIGVNTSYLKILARTEKVTHNSENCRKISD